MQYSGTMVFRSQRLERDPQVPLPEDVCAWASRYVYLSACMPTCIHTYIRTYTQAFVHTYMPTCIHTSTVLLLFACHLFVRLVVQLLASSFTQWHVCLWLSVCLCAFVFIRCVLLICLVAFKLAAVSNILFIIVHIQTYIYICIHINSKQQQLQHSRKS